MACDEDIATLRKAMLGGVPEEELKAVEAIPLELYTITYTKEHLPMINELLEELTKFRGKLIEEPWRAKIIEMMQKLVSKEWPITYLGYEHDLGDACHCVFSVNSWLLRIYDDCGGWDYIDKLWTPTGESFEFEDFIATWGHHEKPSPFFDTPDEENFICLEAELFKILAKEHPCKWHQ